MNDHSLKESLGDLAAGLAASAGRMVFAGRKSGPGVVDTKSSATDVVTEYDRAAERLIIDAILAQRPHDGFLGEEGADEAGTSGVMWLIDPIDGTTNFLYDLAGYAVSIAARIDGITVAGSVYLPATQELFTATLGSGATCNGAPIRCSTTTRLDRSLIGTGFSYSAQRRVAQGQRLARMLPEIRDIRRFGAAAPDLCYVAAGRLDGYFEQFLNPWDEAAGMLIAVEAGAVVGEFSADAEEPPGRIAANPLIFDDLLALVEDRAA